MSARVNSASVVTTLPSQHRTGEQIVNGVISGYRHLTEHHAEALAERAQQASILRTARGAAPQRLAINRHRLKRYRRVNGYGAMGNDLRGTLPQPGFQHVAVDAPKEALHGELARAVGAGKAEGSAPRRAVVLRQLRNSGLAACPQSIAT